MSKKDGNAAAGNSCNGSSNKKSSREKVLSKSLEANIALFRDIFSKDETLIVRRFKNKYLPDVEGCLIYFDGMVSSKIMNESIMQPVLNNNMDDGINGKDLLNELQYKVIASNSVREVSDIDTIVASIINGETAFLLEGFERALVIESKEWKTRSISEPESARVVRGPRVGFTESITVNISLIRRIIRNSDLKFSFKELGERTKTRTCICYIEGIARDDILRELVERLDKIEIDAILDSGYIQELIRDEPFSPFETVGASERPDVIAAKLLEGRIALIVDGSPFVLTVPYVMTESFQSNEDYYNNYIFSSVNRLFRAVSVPLAMSIPAIYLAIVTFHQEMIPTYLLLSISASLHGVPFPTVISLFLMLLIFDVLREAGVRMPSPVGQAVNIVGTLVLGQAAVEAKLVSAPVIIVTAFTGILTLLNKNLIGPTLIIKYLLLFAASVFGVYGYLFVIITVIIHLMNIRSFGVPYMLNVSSSKNHNGQDVMIRAPWWTMTLRPKIIGARNLVRQSDVKSKRK